MIIIPHLVFGAAIGSLIKNPFLAVAVAFLGHYFLDLIPHNEYSIENIKKKQWHKAFPDILKALADFLIGIFLIFIFSGNQPIVYVCAFFAVLSDGLNLLVLFYPNKILEAHSNFHHEKIHFLSNKNPADIVGRGGKKISFFLRTSTQITTVIISIVLMAK
ncbi:MAG: hypothetical protein AAB361_01655 [Patescibacteria group bacterium]